MSEYKGSGNLVGVINEGTGSVAFSLHTLPLFEEIAIHSVNIQLISPKEGWYEQDPNEIMEAIHICCREACDLLPKLGYSVADIATIGITNQRETTVVWDKVTGKPLYNALVWKDIRTNQQVDYMLCKVPGQDKNFYRNISGLPLSPYFSAFKIMWLKENVPEVRKACKEHTCLVGTIDSWIIWNLTNGHKHITDVTNASRTMLMNIDTLHWDPVLLKAFNISINMLPDIRSCSEIHGRVLDENSVLEDIPISGILGNQQASLLGQQCIKPGQTKNTYRSGCFLLCNTGQTRVNSKHGLLTTVAYKLGPNAPTIYALEGSVAVGGHALRWLQSKMRILPITEEAESIALSVRTTGDVYFVPAFTGLYAPYWRKDARGIICGLTQFTTKQHIIRAALESICFQSRDILECMYQEGGFKISKLHADGPLTENGLLMQLQADIAGIPVMCTQSNNPAATGVAQCAAIAEGINIAVFQRESSTDRTSYSIYVPNTTSDERSHRYAKWKRAVERSFGWAVRSKPTISSDHKRLMASIPPGIYMITVFAMMLHAAWRKAK